MGNKRTKTRILAIIVAIAIVSSLLIFHPLSLPSNNPSRVGPTVEGNLTYVLSSNASAFNASTSPASQVNGLIEAFMTNATMFDPSMNGTGYPFMRANSSIPLGTHSLNTNGSFSFNLNYSFYSLKNSWLNALGTNGDLQAEVPIMFEVVFTIPNGSMLNIYTEACPQMFSPLDFPGFFIINHVFTLGTPQEVIQSDNSTGNAPASAPLSGKYNPSDCLLEQKIYWKQTFSNLISNIHFPLIAFNDKTSLNYPNGGDFVLGGTFGCENIPLSFTSAQGFGSESSNASNINGWNFTSSTSATASIDPSNVEYWDALVDTAYPTPFTNSSWNVTYIFLSNVSVQISDYQLIKVLTKVCNGQVTYTDTIAENDWQVQEYIENPPGSHYSVDSGYLPGDFAQAIEDLTGNDSSVVGTISYGHELIFPSAWSNLENGTSSKLANITGLLPPVFAGMGIAVAAAAAIAAPPGGGTVATAALIAEIYSMVGFVSSAVALVSSVIVSSYTQNYAESFSLSGFSPQAFNASVILNPSVLQVGNIEVHALGPLITI